MSFQFQGQQPGEEVRLITRRHPFILLLPTTYAVGILLLPVVFFSLGLSGDSVSMALYLAFFIALGLSASAWFGWYRSILMLTTERLIVVHQKGFFHRELSELRFKEIVQVSTSVNGVLETITNTGTFTVASSAAHDALTIHNIPDGVTIQQMIMDARGLSKIS